MDCRIVAKKLSAYHDGEIPAVEREQVAAHLRSCAACQSALAALEHTDIALQQVPSMTVASDFRARFWQKARQEETRRPASFWERAILRWIPVPVLGALGIVLFLGFSTAAPLLYGLTDGQTKKEIAALVGSTLPVSSAKSVFAPEIFFRFCDGCREMLCKCCNECRGSACPMDKEGYKK